MIKGDAHDKINLMQNPDSRKILKACSESSFSVKELSQKLGIPVAKCYRLAIELEEAGLLHVVDKIRSEGKEFSLYKTDLDFESVRMDGNEIRINMGPEKGYGSGFESGLGIS